MLLLLSRSSRGRLCATPQTAAHQAPPSLGFSRQEHWSGLPFGLPRGRLTRSGLRCPLVVAASQDTSKEYLHEFLLCSSRGQRRQWHPTPVLLPGKSHGRRSLVGCSPWGRTESDMTERLHFHFSLVCIGEGNGNPLQCSCLENPRDSGLPSMGSHRVGHD